jgi:hypothetical protein
MTDEPANQYTAHFVAGTSLLISAIAIIQSRSASTRFTISSTLSHCAFAITVACGLWGSYLFARWILYPASRRKDTAQIVRAFLAFLISALAFVIASASRQVIWQHTGARITVGSDYVRILGMIPNDLADQLDSTVEPDVPLRVVYLENEGGDVDAALRASRWLRQRGADTAVVTGRCASSCAFMALLMPHRYLSREGRLGFHDVHSISGGSEIEARAHRRVIDALIANGIARPTAEWLLASRELIWPSETVLMDSHLIDGCWDVRERHPVTCN